MLRKIDGLWLDIHGAYRVSITSASLIRGRVIARRRRFGGGKECCLQVNPKDKLFDQFCADHRIPPLKTK